MSDRIPTGKWRRGTIAGLTAAKLGARQLGLVSKRPFLSKESYAASRLGHEKAAAKTLFEGLATLRGTALKIAQILSLEMGLLPEAFRRELYKAHYQAPPLNRALIRRVLQAQLGGPPEVLFREFEDRAFAAASLGQVHRALALDGTPLAVKVQYPGIAAAVVADMGVIKRILGPFLRSEFLPRALAEIEGRLNEELDYRLELAQTTWFAEQVHFQGVVTPRPHRRLCSTGVMSSNLLEGRHLDQWLKTAPSQETRDHFGQLLYDFSTHCTFGLGRFHADPNPGNYLFREDGSLAIVDFGCVKIFDDALRAKLIAVTRAQIADNPLEAKRCYRALGLQLNDAELDEFYTDTLQPVGEWLTRPFRAAVFDFAKNPGYCEEGAELLRHHTKKQRFQGFTSETIMLDRNFYGLYRIFGLLGARIRFQNDWLY